MSEKTAAQGRPRYGVYRHGDGPSIWVSDDIAVAQAEVDRRLELGEPVSLHDREPESYPCDRCGSQHNSGYSDYCRTCRSGD